MGIAQELGKDARGDRCGDLSAVEVSATRVVNHNKDGEDRILDGRKAAEGGDIATLKVACRLTANLLRRTGLARDAVPLDARLLSATARDDLLQEPDQCAVNGRFEHAPYLTRRTLLVDGAVGIPNLAHDIGVHERAAVCDGSHCRDELQRGHGDTLPDRRRCDIRVAHIVGIEEDALLLARKVDARALAKAKDARVVHHLLRTEGESHLRKARVERLLYDVGEGDRAVAFVAPVLDPPSRHHNVAGVEEDLIRRNDALLECRACNNRLERGARLVDEGDGTVLPILLWILPEAVGVIGGARCHGENLARLWIHDNRRDGVRVVLRHRTVELLLDHELNRAVDGQ